MTHVLLLQNLKTDDPASCVYSGVSCSSDLSCLSFNSNPVQTHFV